MTEPLIPGGYIILSRKIIESEIFSKPPLYMKVWVYLLSVAQHADYKQLKRGQLFISIPDIIQAVSWKVGYRTVKPTKDQVFQVLNWLRKGDEAHDESNTSPMMITTTKATHGLLINIENYSFYQNPKNYESNGDPNDEKGTKPERKQRQSDNINKNVKNVKNDKNVKKENENINNNITAEIISFWDRNGFGFNNINSKEKLLMYMDEGLEGEVILKALEIAEETNKKSYKYVEKVLNNWIERGVKSVSDVESLQKEYADKQTNIPRKGKIVREEQVPDWMKEQDKPQEPENDPDLEERKRAIEERLKKLKQKEG